MKQMEKQVPGLLPSLQRKPLREAVGIKSSRYLRVINEDATAISVISYKGLRSRTLTLV